MHRKLEKLSLKMSDIKNEINISLDDINNYYSKTSLHSYLMKLHFFIPKTKKIRLCQLHQNL